MRSRRTNGQDAPWENHGSGVRSRPSLRSRKRFSISSERATAASSESAPVSLELDQGAEPGAQRQQVEDALSIGRPAVPKNTNVGSELLCELYQSVSRPEVQAEFIGNLRSSSPQTRHNGFSSQLVISESTARSRHRDPPPGFEQHLKVSGCGCDLAAQPPRATKDQAISPLSNRPKAARLPQGARSVIGRRLSALTASRAMAPRVSRGASCASPYRACGFPLSGSSSPRTAS